MGAYTYKITVTGLVQGIGFRPFVAELAEELKLTGQVKNLGGIVEIIVSGDKQAVDTFIHRLNFVGGQEVPSEHRMNSSFEHIDELPGCRIDSLEMKEIAEDVLLEMCNIDVITKKENVFRIVESGTGREVRRFLPVDLPTCDRCVEEMHDVNNRRYRYPFISCTACGPRFSIQKAVPYDRGTITMDDFPMCEECNEEYTQKGNIRRHAQTIACKDCGPRLRYVMPQEVVSSGKNNVTDFLQIENEQQAISEAVQALKNEKIGAIKDIGGYHFTFSPFSSRAAKRLREFKNRDKKPFAVMFLNLDEVKEYCEVSEKEAAILSSSARPIVLLKKKKDFVPEICGESDRIGALLPCNPLQILLLEETGLLVMTSGNRGGEPIIISEAEMRPYIGNGIDFMLSHDREILTPLDDSIYQVNEDKVQLIRRARGLVPEPITLQRKLSKDTLAAGGDLKASFALGRDELVYMSQYFGDLEDVRCMESRENGLKRMESLLEIHPEITVGDLHPAYVSAQNKEHKIQHHHAHVASVIAEHGLEGRALGIACDGTGYGTDGTIWGSEFLLCEEEQMTRVGHFSSVKLVGGDASAKQADLTLYSYMLNAREKGLEVERFFDESISACVGDSELQNLKLQEMAWKQNINTAYSSSMGRLFDATAALLDICHYNSYEGECAIMLEQAAHTGKQQLEQLGQNVEDVCKVLVAECRKEGATWQVDSEKILADLYHLKETYSKEILAYLFHLAVSNAIVQNAINIRKEYDVNQIALSGGTFINRILLNDVMTGLQKHGLHVCINEKVPCGDGGIALGQMYLMTFEE